MDRKVHFIFVWAGIGLLAIYLLQTFFPIVTEIFKLRHDVLFIEPWRLLTSVFVHASWGHVLSNLLGFVLFGVVLESIVGWRRAVLFSLICGVFASLVSGLFYPSGLGASGLVFGLIGMLMIWRPFAPAFAFGVPLPMFVAGVAWGVSNIGGLFIESSTGYIAHLAGLFCGIVIAFLFYREFGAKFSKKTKLLSEEEFTNWEKRHMK